MPRFRVKVKLEQERWLNVYARDEEQAAETAEAIVGDWNGVSHAEAQDVEEH